MGSHPFRRNRHINISHYLTHRWTALWQAGPCASHPPLCQSLNFQAHLPGHHCLHWIVRHQSILWHTWGVAVLFDALANMVSLSLTIALAEGQEKIRMSATRFSGQIKIVWKHAFHLTFAHAPPVVMFCFEVCAKYQNTKKEEISRMLHESEGHCDNHNTSYLNLKQCYLPNLNIWLLNLCHNHANVYPCCKNAVDSTIF